MVRECVCVWNFEGWRNHLLGPVVLIYLMHKSEAEDFKDFKVPELNSLIHTNWGSTYLVPGNCIGPASQRWINLDLWPQAAWSRRETNGWDNQMRCHVVNVWGSWEDRWDWEEGDLQGDFTEWKTFLPEEQVEVRLGQPGWYGKTHGESKYSLEQQRVTLFPTPKVLQLVISFWDSTCTSVSEVAYGNLCPGLLAP